MAIFSLFSMHADQDWDQYEKMKRMHPYHLSSLSAIDTLDGEQKNKFRSLIAADSQRESIFFSDYLSVTNAIIAHSETVLTALQEQAWNNPDLPVLTNFLLKKLIEETKALLYLLENGQDLNVEEKYYLEWSLAERVNRLSYVTMYEGPVLLVKLNF